MMIVMADPMRCFILKILGLTPAAPVSRRFTEF